MRYCPDCGAGHECEKETGTERSEVEIMRLQCERDIKVAAINARAATAISETEAEHSSEHAEGFAEGMETALGAVTGGDGDDAPEGDPIVVDTSETDADAGAEPEGEPDSAPPVVDIPEPKSARASGWWGGYR